VVAALDGYGLSREDFFEALKDLQFKIEKDSVLCDQFEKLDSKVTIIILSVRIYIIHQ
jgi:hypothetical protein